jgi:hypothetical protein
MTRAQPPNLSFDQCRPFEQSRDWKIPTFDFPASFLKLTALRHLLDDCVLPFLRQLHYAATPVLMSYIHKGLAFPLKCGAETTLC